MSTCEEREKKTELTLIIGQHLKVKAMNEQNPEWLSELLANGFIKDNTFYEKREIIPDSIFWDNNKSQKIHRFSGYRRMRNEHREDLIWKFLNKSSWRITNLLQDKKFIKKHVILFDNNDYEHNTSDSLFQVNGTSFSNWTLQTGNLVGFIKGESGDYSLKVSSRFGNNFLKALIADAEGFLEVEDFGGIDGQSDMDWLLKYFWKIKLKRAFRLGIPKAYTTVNEPLTSMRGNLDLIDYAIRGKHTARYQCQYRLHSFNNPINQLIHTTFQKLKSEPQNQSLFSDVLPIHRAFAIAVKGKKVPLKKLAAIETTNNPYYQSYNEVIQLSKKILRDEFADFGAASDMNALFFDVSMLFEYFIRKIVSRAGVRVHPKNDRNKFLIPSGGTYKQGSRALYPDLIFDDEAGNTHVFDVKYKRFDFKYGVKREDLFQIHTYFGQVANQQKVVRCGLIYPILEDNSNCPKHSVITNTFQFHGNTVLFEVHFLKIPKDSKNLEPQYRKVFTQYKTNFINQLLGKYDAIKSKK